MSPKTPSLSATPRITSASVLATSTNDSAAWGSVGEFISVLLATGSAVSFTSPNARNVIQMPLAQGDWDVEANVNATAAGATQTAFAAGISLTTATLPTDGSEAYSGILSTTANFVQSVTLPRKRISIAAATAHTPITGVAATNVITDTAHGYADGQPIYFTAITGGAGLVINTIYYVISSATDTYKVSATSGGAEIDFTTAITAGIVKAATLVYLVGKATFSAGTEVGFGAINARRVR